MQPTIHENTKIPQPSSDFGFFCDYCKQWQDGLPAMATPEGLYICTECARLFNECITCYGWFEVTSLIRGHCPDCARARGMEMPRASRVPERDVVERDERSQPIREQFKAKMAKLGIDIDTRRAEWARRCQEAQERIKNELEKLTPEERALYDRFMVTYAKCPVCGMKVEAGTLHRLFMNPHPFQKLVSDAMKAALKEHSGALLGIPCCRCFATLGGRREPGI